MQVSDMATGKLGRTPTVHRGHRFVVYNKPTWCDSCELFIWGFYRQSCLRCKECKLTIHGKCMPDVAIDCSKVQSQGGSSLDDDGVEISTDTAPSSKDEDLSEIQKAVKQYNSHSTGMVFSMMPDGQNFSGFIWVQLNLCRPVNVVSEEGTMTLRKAISNSSSLSSTSSRQSSHVRRASFYLPQGALSALHTHSSAKAPLVVEQLLQKYNVTTNPKKYSLFEKTLQGIKVVMRKLGNDECPLLIMLGWGPNSQTQSFVMQEYDNGEVQWDMFSAPELRNFLRILNQEESEAVSKIRSRYSTYAEMLKQLIGSKGGDLTSR